MSFLNVPIPPAASGGGKLALVETKTLSDASTTTFSGFAAGKTFLLVYNVRTGVSATSQQVMILVNGSTTSTYDYIRYNGAALSSAANTNAYRLNIGNGTICCGAVLISGEGRSDGTANAFIGLGSFLSQWGGGTQEAAITGNWDSGGTADVDLTSLVFRNDNVSSTITGTVSLFRIDTT